MTTLAKDGAIEDTEVFISEKITRKDIDATLKSLDVDLYVVLKVITRENIVLLPEGQKYAKEGSLEFAFVNAIKMGETVTLEEIKKRTSDDIAKTGMGKAKNNKWIEVKGQEIKRIIENPVDENQEDLQSYLANPVVSAHDAKKLKEYVKRKHIKLDKSVSYNVQKGPDFAPQRVKHTTDITAEMLRNDEWKKHTFKAYNFNALGRDTSRGALHPLLLVREQFKEIFLEMGFSEMRTNRFVESSFWNFDALFQPQSHPARDAHDTFFILKPATTNSYPMDYMERVKKVHSVGDYGSKGYEYEWKEEEAKKNILRTHTTAISS